MSRIIYSLEVQETTPEMHKQISDKKIFDKKAVESLTKEMAQSLDFDVFEGITANTLMAEEKKRALIALSLVKLKSDLILKGRIVANGRIHRNIYTKDETTSSTCHNDTLMMT